MSHVEFLKCEVSLFFNSYVDFKTVACRMSNLRNGPRPVDNMSIGSMSYVDFFLKNGHVDLSNLRVKGHAFTPILIGLIVTLISHMPLRR